jgi:hypothetical protein
MMCDLFYACSYQEVSNFLSGLGLYVLCLVFVGGLVWVGIESERAKRTGIDIDQIDRIISEARKRAYERGRDDFGT